MWWVFPRSGQFKSLCFSSLRTSAGRRPATIFALTRRGYPWPLVWAGDRFALTTRRLQSDIGLHNAAALDIEDLQVPVGDKSSKGRLKPSVESGTPFKVA